MKKLVIILCIMGMFWACNGPEARRPVQGKTDRFIAESVIRNKQILAHEESLIREKIKEDTLHDYIASGSGFWYYYEIKNADEAERIQSRDKVRLTYTLANLDQDTLYNIDEIGIQEVSIDQEALFPGLREGLKLLKNGEKATFLFPSAMAYGYPGDQDRIGTNVPLRCSVTILDVKQAKDSIL